MYYRFYLFIPCILLLKLKSYPELKSFLNNLKAFHLPTHMAVELILIWKAFHWSKLYYRKYRWGRLPLCPRWEMGLTDWAGWSGLVSCSLHSQTWPRCHLTPHTSHLTPHTLLLTHSAWPGPTEWLESSLSYPLSLWQDFITKSTISYSCDQGFFQPRYTWNLPSNHGECSGRVKGVALIPMGATKNLCISGRFRSFQVIVGLHSSSNVKFSIVVCIYHH